MKRGPTPAELDALTAWWMAQRHIGRAAVLLGRSRQRVANNLLAFRRLEGATDNVELALRHLDDIERNWTYVLSRIGLDLRKSPSISGGPQPMIERTGTTIPANTRIRHNTEFSYTGRHTGTIDSTPMATVSPPRSDVTRGTESGESWVDASSHVNAAIALGLQLGGLLAGQHRIPHQSVIAEHRVVEAHAGMVAA